ncbi:MAG: hypothetical protein AAGC57_03655 [Pseudomonadota bacterium]
MADTPVTEETDSAVDAALIRAHAQGDQALLARLYAETAEAARRAGDTDREAFFLTHAYVFGLQSGAADTARMHARLIALGREE